MAIKDRNRKINCQDWLSSLPLFPYYHIQVGNLRIAYKFRNSYSKIFYENSLSKNIRKFSEKGPILIKSGMKKCNFSKAVLYHKCFLGNFLKCLEHPYVKYLKELFKYFGCYFEYLNIARIRFHLSQ